MRVEVPELKRGYVCLPLRYSLIFVAYFRLLFLAIDMGVKIAYLISQEDKTTNIYSESLFFSLDLVDFVFVVILIIGSHTKNVMLIKTFYYYGLGDWILQTLIVAGVAIFLLYVTFILYLRSKASFYPSSTTWKFLMTISYLTFLIIIRGYFILLVKSEIIKLKNNSLQNRFVNNAAESECAMTYKKTDEDKKVGTNSICDEEISESKETCCENIQKLTNQSECSINKMCDEEQGTKVTSSDFVAYSESIHHPTLMTSETAL